MAVEQVTTVVPATTKTTENIVCDLCGAKADGDEWDQKDEGWRSEYAEVSIVLARKESAPEFGSTSQTHYDCCPACFETKVMPALEGLGLKPRKTEASW